MPVGQVVKTNIGYAVDVPGLVPIFEEYDAMIESNHNESEWKTLSPESKAKAVAYYRLKQLIKLNENDAVAGRMKQLSKRK